MNYEPANQLTVMLDVIPGIFEKELSEIEHKVALVAPHAEWVQIDFADGQFVPATSFLDVALLKPLIDRYPALRFEAHLMVASPEKFIKPLVDAGFKRIIAHVEANDPRLFLEHAKFESVETGLAIDGPTEAEIIEPFAEEIDVVLVMMAEAGSSGMALQQENVEKVRTIHEHYPNLTIEVDQGINEKTAPIVKDAGASAVVTTSFIFKNPTQAGELIEHLKNL
jgi:ribulose-phosphate 3-epimerase